MKLPVYVTVKEVADILGWTNYRARRWLKSAGALVQRGDKLVTTPEKLRDSFPELWEQYMSMAEDREE